MTCLESQNYFKLLVKDENAVYPWLGFAITQDSDDIKNAVIHEQIAQL